MSIKGKSSPYEIGGKYFIRTVTHHYTGILLAVYDNELLLENACWIPDDGRFFDSMIDFKKFKEIEPFPKKSPTDVSRTPACCRLSCCWR